MATNNSMNNANTADMTISGMTVGKGGGQSATNTVVGAGALGASNTNTNLVAIGNAALASSTGSAASAIAIGYHAMQLATAPGANSIAIGSTVMGGSASFSGADNIGIGTNALTLLQNGTQNVCVGSSTGAALVSGGGVVAIGYLALSSATGSANTAVGSGALRSIVAGTNNVGIGDGTGFTGASGAVATTSGLNNTFLGHRASGSSASISGGIALGVDSVAIASTGATSGDNGVGISIGSASVPVGFRGDGTIYSGGTGRGYWRPTINGTAYLMPCFIDGTLTTGAAMVTDGNGSPILTATMSAGQILIGTTAGAPTAAAINSGTGIIVANGSGSITISATGGGLAIATISGTTQSAAVNTTYIALNSGQTTVTLPAVYAVGDIIRLVGATANTGGWVLTAAAGDTVRINNATTSAGGTVTCTAVAGQCIEVVADVANTSWVMTSTASVLLTTA